MDHFADIPTHSAKRHKSCRILSPSQNTLSDTQQYVTNTAKFCPPLKTYSQTLSNTSSILSNSVPQSIYTQYAVPRFRSDRALILGNCYHTTPSRAFSRLSPPSQPARPTCRAKRCPRHVQSSVRKSNGNDVHSARPVGLMDKVSASGAGDSRFESWTGHTFCSLAPSKFRCSFSSGVLRWFPGGCTFFRE